MRQKNFEFSESSVSFRSALLFCRVGGRHSSRGSGLMLVSSLSSRELTMMTRVTRRVHGLERTRYAT